MGREAVTMCFVCMNDALCGLPMQDKDTLSRGARDFVQGLILTAAQSTQGTFKNFQPSRRRGVCIVERCARSIEEPCRSCQEDGCFRCRLAAELRSSKDRINAARDAELAELGFDDTDLEELVDKVVGGLCTEHVAFGPVLVDQWYGRQNFLRSPTSNEA